MVQHRNIHRTEHHAPSTFGAADKYIADGTDDHAGDSWKGWGKSVDVSMAP